MFHRHDHDNDEPQRDVQEVEPAPEPAGEPAEPWALDGPELVMPDWTEEARPDGP